MNHSGRENSVRKGPKSGQSMSVLKKRMNCRTVGEHDIK